MPPLWQKQERGQGREHCVGAFIITPSLPHVISFELFRNIQRNSKISQFFIGLILFNLIILFQTFRTTYRKFDLGFRLHKSSYIVDIDNISQTYTMI